ncbi:MAG TPA: hypothetical protein VJP87_06830 [Candidatus Acidoferrales bacterium]|nr:hypothetical protein [Candidatus Acidoferrales bacterium]
MEIVIRVTDELLEEARARGLEIGAYVQEVLAEHSARRSTQVSPRTAQEIQMWIDHLAQFSDKIPPLPENISREWLYQDHD